MLWRLMMPSISELLERESTTVDLEPGDFERLVRRRDRRRRNRRISAGVVGIAVFVAAIWIVTSGGVFDRSETSVVPGGDVTGPTVDPFSLGFNGLPPEDATPSEPLFGELVMRDSGIDPRFAVNVYADGRLIWFRQDHGDYPNTWIEQRLTPEGVNLLVSGAVPLGGQFEDPGGQLPAGAWEDLELRPYVPWRYAVLPSCNITRCLPAAAQGLVAGTERPFRGGRLKHGWFAGHFVDVVGTSSAVGFVFQVPIADARAIAEILSNAGFEEGEAGPVGMVWFSASNGVADGDEDLIQFVPVLPDGTIETLIMPGV
jgi:hypothetical protein